MSPHVATRRHTSARLARRLVRVRELLHRPGRLALADTILALLTVAMLVAGFWDWFAGHPTKIRWHAITGILLAVFVVVHTVRRRKRLRASAVR